VLFRSPVKHPAIPEVAGASNPIDAFILARLEKEGLKPSPRADKRTLIRRATIDLTGLPPSPEEVDAFLKDESPDAFAEVIDRLLASPRYGERWARYWLDVARYADDSFLSTEDKAYPNSWRYRNWVIKALNDDTPYDKFVRAQIAGDQIGEPAGTGFYALSPEMQDDRVDATTRGFLALTVACAGCHDHKFDPIPTKDFYSLQAIFSNTKLDEFPLADETTVKSWKEHKEALDKAEAAEKKFYEKQTEQLGEMLAARSDEYMLAARGLGNATGLDSETVERWKTYLSNPRKDYPFLKNWFAAQDERAVREEAVRVKDLILQIIDEKKTVDKKNEITLGLNPEREDLAKATLVSLDRDKYCSGAICLRKPRRMRVALARLRTACSITAKGRSTGFCKVCGRNTPSFWSSKRRRPRQRSLSSIRFYKSSRIKRRSKRGTYSSAEIATTREKLRRGDSWQSSLMASARTSKPAAADSNWRTRLRARIIRLPRECS